MSYTVAVIAYVTDGACYLQDRYIKRYLTSRRLYSETHAMRGLSHFAEKGPNACMTVRAIEM